MLVFIENKPRAYHWGLTDALPEMLGEKATGEPQAELWLGDNPGSPAHVAKATPRPLSLIELIESDPECYGYEGGPLPFLLKVLAIGSPLSLQVHPDLDQARQGFAREDAAGIPRDSACRNYRDPNHKPELLVALTPTRALAGFRPLAAARADVAAIVAALPAAAAPTFAWMLRELSADAAGGSEAVRIRLLRELFAEQRRGEVRESLAALGEVLASGEIAGLGAARAAVLRELLEFYPEDAGVLVSLLLHCVELHPGEALYLPARMPHAYLSGVAVEVMASSDNVLRAGLTTKHVDVAELTRVVDARETPVPLCTPGVLGAGLTAWRPPVSDFQLLRVCVTDPSNSGGAAVATLPARQPMVAMVTKGSLRVERTGAEFSEVVTASRGESLYVSVGGELRITGCGEAYIATVNDCK